MYSNRMKGMKKEEKGTQVNVVRVVNVRVKV